MKRYASVGVCTALLAIGPLACGGLLAADKAATPGAAAALKISEVGIEFNAETAKQLALRRVMPDSTPLTLLSVGPGCPGLAPAPKMRVVKYPAHWTVVDTPKELGGVEASPEALLSRLPEVLLGKKPEVVLLWGDAEEKRAAKGSERYDWEDVVTVCLRMGSLPILVLPNGQVSFADGNAALIGEPKKQDDPKADGPDAGGGGLEILRHGMLSLGGSRGIPMVEQAPFATTSDRLARMLNLIEKHVLGRTPPKTKSGPDGAGKGTGTGTKNPEDIE